MKNPNVTTSKKALAKKRNETAHFVSLPTEGFLFICLVFLFVNMISGSRVMAIVFGHMGFRNHESQYFYPVCHVFWWKAIMILECEIAILQSLGH